MCCACGIRDAPPTATGRLADAVPPAAVQVRDLAIPLPNEATSDTLVTLGGPLQLRVTARDAAGRVVSGSPALWASDDTSLATISEGGMLQVRRSGLVQLTASVGTVTTTRAFLTVLIDGVAVGDVLEDPLVAHLVRGLSPTVGTRVQAALAASGAALAAGNAPMLRTLGANVAQTLDGADDPADRAVLAVLELYARRLQRVLSLSHEN
jgi:hypothetical protein